MIRISRLADYGIVLMSYMAAHLDRVHNASGLAAEVHLPLPTASKLLRLLAREGILESHRGARGGYSLARAPERISLADIIRAVEGPIGVTTCTDDSRGDCKHEPVCPVRGHWHRINSAVRQALANIPLSEMASPVLPHFTALIGSGWNQPAESVVDPPGPPRPTS